MTMPEISKEAGRRWRVRLGGGRVGARPVPAGGAALGLPRDACTAPAATSRRSGLCLRVCPPNRPARTRAQELTDEEKEPYNKLAAEDKKRAEREKAAYAK